VDVFDEEGNPVLGQKGELVCTKPFPSMPLGFWNDRGDQRYHAAYFAKYPNVWCHGDWSELTERGTMLVYGRSDATLNPGGVRIGTAEIYNVVERIDEVEESVAIGQLWPPDKPGRRAGRPHPP
jgi:acetoacetyl-CoA synthetase